MKRLIWLTDLHLNFAAVNRIEALLAEIRDAAPDFVLVGGDTGEAPSFGGSLRKLASAVDVPVYFVLGNHDYYRGSITEVRETARSLSNEPGNLFWLPAAGAVSLTSNTAIVGHGGWGDGRVGSFLESDVVLNDYFLIEELRDCHRTPVPMPEFVLVPRLLEKLQSLGDEAAAHLRQVLPEALRTHDHVLVLTHVPPFLEACWHEGRLSDSNWAPHFTCRALGEALVDIVQAHAGKRVTVFCGHTHSAGHAQILDNLEVLTGGARYGDPAIQQVVSIE